MFKSKVNLILKSSFWIFLSNLISKVTGIIILPLIARLLGPSSLGIYALVQYVIQTGDNFSRLGIDIALHRKGSQYQTIEKESVEVLFGVASCLLLIFSLFVAAILVSNKSFFATNLLGDADILEWLPLSALIIVLNVSGEIPRLFLMALQEFRLQSLRDIVVNIVGSIIIILLAFSFGLSGAIYGILITSIIRLFWGGWLAYSVLNQNQIGLRINHFIRETIEIFRFGLPFYLSNFLTNFITLPLLGWLTSLSGVEQIGYIRVAQSMAQLLSFIPGTIAPVVFSFLSASFASDQSEYNKLRSLHLRTLWVIVLLVAVIISFGMEFIVRSLFGENFTQAILFSKIMIWNVAISNIAEVFNQHLVSAGKTRITAIWSTGGILIQLLSSFVLIPKYKTIGFLLSQSLSTVFRFFGLAKSGLRGIENKEQVKIKQLFWVSLLALIISFLLPLLLNKYLIILIPLETIFMLGLLWLTFKIGFKTEEKKLLGTIIKNQLQKLNKK